MKEDKLTKLKEELEQYQEELDIVISESPVNNMGKWSKQVRIENLLKIINTTKTKIKKLEK